MLLRIERLGPGRLRLAGEIDVSTVGDLQGVVDAELATVRDELVLGLADVEFMDSAGIQLIVSTAQRLGERRLVLDRPGEAIGRVLTLVGVPLIANVRIVDERPSE